MSKQTENDQFIKSMILDSLDFEGRDLKVLPITNKDKITQLKLIFVGEYGWRINQVGQVQAMTDWLQGLPSCINIPWENYDIIKNVLKPSGQVDEKTSEKKIDSLLNNYFNYVANKTIQLFNGRAVPKDLT